MSMKTGKPGYTSSKLFSLCYYYKQHYMHLDSHIQICTLLYLYQV